MKKVVINSCFGGFGLSPLAVKRLAELQGRECHFFGLNYQSKFREYIPLSLEAANKELCVFAFDTPIPPEISEKWGQLSDEQKDAQNANYARHSIQSGHSINREDPLLIRVVEELGEAANGRCADLKILEIPDDVQYEIDEYDGLESIHEIHRSWS